MTKWLVFIAFTVLAINASFANSPNELELGKIAKEKLNIVRDLKTNGAVVYVVMAKSAFNPFFLQVENGCKSEAKRLGHHCILLSTSTEDARVQAKLVSQLLTLNVDGIALSAISKDWVEQSLYSQISSWGGAFVSFDSSASHELSTVYIGTDNYQLGVLLGKAVREKKPNGGVYCIQSSRPDTPNHQLRVKGILDGLLPKGQSNVEWKEGFGCPLYYYGDIEAAAGQMERMIRRYGVDAFITASGGAQFRPDIYRPLMAPYKEAIEQGKLIIANADTENMQLEYIAEGISSINVGQRPFDMGVMSVQMLDRLRLNRVVPSVIYTKITFCTKDNVSTCNNSSY